MATLSTPEIDRFANEWEKIFGSAVHSGTVGDLAHKARGGYHISIEDQPSSNYSVVRKDDKAPPGTWPRNRASAVDMSMNTSDMKKCHGRLVAVFRNRASDPRAKYINCFNGWDGNGTPGRYDMVDGSVESATSDHEWHEHLEIRRKYVNSRIAMDAILSILRGETVQQYLGEDFPVEQAEFNNLMNGYLDSAAGKTNMAQAVWDYVYGTTSSADRWPTSPNKSMKTWSVLNTIYTWDGVKAAAVAVANEAAEDAAEAVRDAATSTLLQSIQTAIGNVDGDGVISPEQMQTLITAIKEAAQDAAEEAGQAANAKVERLMQVLASAGDEMGKADDTLPPPSGAAQN